jgi:NADH-quinone oxidoreductase subunit C
MADPLAVANTIKEKFPEAVAEIVEFRGEVTVVIAAESLLDVARFCYETEGLEFNHMADLAAVDYWPEEPRFAVNYVLRSMIHRHMIRLKVYLPDAKPVVDSVIDIWAGANWPEREAWDMFGIKFEGHPNPRRILMPFDWTGHPQRKDYPQGYEEVQFSFNYDRVQAKKPHPED